MREALKRLEQLGLISTSRAGGAEVTDFKRKAGLEVLAMMAEHAHGDQMNKYLLSVLEMRALIGIDVVRLCAQRASRDVRDALVSLARAMRTTTSDDTIAAIQPPLRDAGPG